MHDYRKLTNTLALLEIANCTTQESNTHRFKAACWVESPEHTMCEETCEKSGFSHTLLGTSVLEWSQMKTDQWVK